MTFTWRHEDRPHQQLVLDLRVVLARATLHGEPLGDVKSRGPPILPFGPEKNFGFVHYLTDVAYCCLDCDYCHFHCDSLSHLHIICMIWRGQPACLSAQARPILNE